MLRIIIQAFRIYIYIYINLESSSSLPPYIVTSRTFTYMPAVSVIASRIPIVLDYRTD